VLPCGRLDVEFFRRFQNFFVSDFMEIVGLHALFRHLFRLDLHFFVSIARIHIRMQLHVQNMIQEILDYKVFDMQVIHLVMLIINQM